MTGPLKPSEIRAKNRRAYDLFWAAYPKKVAPTEAERAFSEVVERGADPEHLIKKARAYAESINPADMRYVPSPHAWLRQGRYDDVDLFTNEIEQEHQWLRQCWRDANVTAVEERFHIKFEKAYPPEGMLDTDAINLWYRETARAWITKVYEEMIACRQKQPMTSSQNNP